MKIDQLPVEILMKVVSFLPSFSEISLVNKLFYNIVRKVNDSKICLRIDSWLLERHFSDTVIDHKCLQSFRASKREITKVEIGDHFFRLYMSENQKPIISSIISILESFSETIKTVKCSEIIVDESAFLEILSSTPNVEHLDVKRLQISDQNEEQSSKKRRPNDDLILTKLKKLSISLCDDQLAAVFSGLSVGILTELRIGDVHWSILTDVLNRQLNIKVLKLGRIQGNVGSTEILEKLELESLELDGHGINSITIAAILSKQRKLKSLILSSGTAVDTQVMAAVVDNPELETLSLNVSQTPVFSFASFRKLKKLANFTLLFNSIDTPAKLKELAASNNTSILHLTIRGFFSLTPDVVIALAKSAKHLKHLRVLPTEFVDFAELDTIMTHFNFIEVLAINTVDEFLCEKGNYFNEKLRELAIASPGLLYKSWLTRLIASYPNLKKLKLIIQQTDFVSEEVNSIRIESILNGFTQLESLTVVASFTDLIVEDLDCLLCVKNKLKFVSLGRLKGLTDEFIEKLRKNFDMVRAECDYLNVAVGRYAIDSDRKVYSDEKSKFKVFNDSASSLSFR